MDSNSIRQTFLNYFKSRGHTAVPSSSLVPTNDPSLLFTNAGMVQFKDIFLGLESFNGTCATSAQRCMRAGGKHNDLENVGYTARHHTFFEMLGNFSFGDYFKAEAIRYAWELLTEHFKLPPEKLWVTVYQDDAEAEAIWLNDIKVDPKRFSRCGEKDNFWMMGDTGPCGPCSEIFYDHGPEIAGGPPGSPEADGDRYIEIWNLVFMQYERSATGELTALPKPSVDTGMGLERLAAVLQGVHNNYDIDLFRNIIANIMQLSGHQDSQNPSLRVIADHIRSCTFLITDGVIPSNEGRGYVLRRIIRRAIRHGHKVGLREPFFHKLVSSLVNEMGGAYPELITSQAVAEKILMQEEQAFAQTLEQGLKIFQQELTKLSSKQIPGDVVFKLYDTYGFPADLTADMAREYGLSIDLPSFEKCKAQQREQSRAASHFSALGGEPVQDLAETDFSGYELLGHDAQVTALFIEERSVMELNAGQTGAVVLDRTPFYAESGGQVGDQGILRLADGEFHVLDTKKRGQVFLHYGRLQYGRLSVNDKVEAAVNIKRRRAAMLNHSATHLLHAALRQVLGEHVMQKGSLVEPERLRFDFAHYEPVTTQQLQEIEALVNQHIRDNTAVKVEVMTPEQAKQQGALALFGEKYGDHVRVLTMAGDFSKELCGGTHVKYTGDIGICKIILETGIAAGIRRIEAITGEAALEWLNQWHQTVAQLSHELKVKPEQVVPKIQQILQEKKQLEREVTQLQAQFAKQQSHDLLAQVQQVGSINVLTHQMTNIDINGMRELLDQLKNKLTHAAIVLATVNDGRVQLIAGVTKDCLAQFNAKDLINHVAVQVGGRGGGRPDMAQAGGDQPAKLGTALASVTDWIAQQIGTD
ncbi:MAG: alanine--tRNA ligase [Gammaproteobacteria bacterium]